MRINYRRMISKEMYFDFFFFIFIITIFFSVIYVTQNTDLLKIFYHNWFRFPNVKAGTALCLSLVKCKDSCPCNQST